MSTYILKLCLVWLCFLYICISIFSLFILIYFSTNFYLEIFLTTNKNVPKFLVREAFLLFVLRLAPHCPSFATHRWQQLRCFFVVFDSVCSSVSPYFFWVSLYVLRQNFFFLPRVLLKGLVLFACHLSSSSSTLCSPWSWVCFVCLELPKAALISSPAFPTFRMVFALRVLVLRSLMFCHLGCFSLSNFFMMWPLSFPSSRGCYMSPWLCKVAFT